MSRKIPERVQKILKKTRKELDKIYPERIKEMILFGSYARGDFTEDSDIDLMLLLDQIADVSVEREKYFPIISKISFDYDTVVSIVPFDYQEFQKKRIPLILNVNKEGIRI